MTKYREFDVAAPDYVPMSYYSSEMEDPAAYLASLQGSYNGDGEAAAKAELRLVPPHHRGCRANRGNP
jgi:hypothetical protein